MINEFEVKETMKKTAFVKKLCEYWYEGLSEQNIVSDVSTTGIYPAGNKNFPRKQFDTRLLSRYNKWLLLVNQRT